MSDRGRKFLDNWLAEQLSCCARESDRGQRLGRQLMTAAEKAGIGADEINGEVESVFEVIFEAMRRRQTAHPSDA
jgi:hypothetical protein